MGCNFSSNQLAGATYNGIPATSYAYASTNTKLFGVDATLTCQVTDIIGEVTPYLAQPSGSPTLTCNPFTINRIDQSISCPVQGTTLAPGRYTLLFSQYSSTTTTNSGGSTITTRATPTYGSNTLSSILFADKTFSIVTPFNNVAPTTTTTATATSGVVEASATSTSTVPKTTVTVTVYSTTLVSTSTSLTTFKTGTVTTVTASCPSAPSKSSKCNANNCLRALNGRPASASSFCSQYTTNTAMPTPSYLSACSGQAASVSSACSCFASSTVSTMSTMIVRGVSAVVYGPPDFTYSSVATVTSSSTATVASATTTDPNSTVSSGTATSTNSQGTTITVTVTKGTVTSTTTPAASTYTVTPASCSSASL